MSWQTLAPGHGGLPRIDAEPKKPITGSQTNPARLSRSLAASARGKRCSAGQS